jgi:hypothetical protein
MFPNLVGISLGDAGGGHSHGFDRPPADLRVRIVGQGDEASQNARPLRRHLGNLFETPFVEQLAQDVFQS